MNKLQLAENHNFLKDTTFRIKSVILTLKRSLKNIINPTKRFRNNNHLQDENIIASSESELWNPYDNKDNWILTAGKVENLRIAVRKINGIEVKANEIFSFWKHIGNPNFGKGYVIGREIREGCIVPTIAGGLCQLSNALYDNALKANFEIIERHKHTKVIKGSLAEQNRDATVKWNYIDLRIKSKHDFRIEAELSASKLNIIFRGKQNKSESNNQKLSMNPSNKLNDCYSCGNLACYKHSGENIKKQNTSLTTYILDYKWPEYDNYIKSKSTNLDYFITPLKKSIFIKTNRYTWSSINPLRWKATTKEGIYRALKLRLLSKDKNNVFEQNLKLDKKIAKAAAKLIPVESSHIVVSQNLLPFLYESIIKIFLRLLMIHLRVIQQW